MIGTREVIDAVATFAVAAREGSLSVRSHERLTEAVRVAVKRDVGDQGWLWARRSVDGDLTPLVAASVAAGVAASVELPLQVFV